MPKLKVVWIRWVLLLANVALLGFFCTAAFSFFKGDSDELSLNLADTDRFVVKAQTGEKGGGRGIRLVGNLYQVKPVPTQIAPPVQAVETKVNTSGGPLDGWYILSIANLGGETVAFVSDQPPVDETANPMAGVKDAGAKPAGTGSRTPRPKPAGVGRARGGAGAKGKNGMMVVGKDFWDLGVIIEEITFAPEAVIYQDKASKRRYTITRDYKRVDLRDGLHGDPKALFEDNGRARLPQPDPNEMPGKIEPTKGAGAKTGEEAKQKDGSGASAENKSGTAPLTEEENKEIEKTLKGEPEAGDEASDAQKKVSEAIKKAKEKKEGDAETPPEEKTEQPEKQPEQGNPEGAGESTGEGGQN